MDREKSADCPRQKVPYKRERERRNRMADWLVSGFVRLNLLRPVCFYLSVYRSACLSLSAFTPPRRTDGRGERLRHPGTDVWGRAPSFFLRWDERQKTDTFPSSIVVQMNGRSLVSCCLSRGRFFFFLFLLLFFSFFLFSGSRRRALFSLEILLLSSAVGLTGVSDDKDQEKLVCPCFCQSRGKKSEEVERERDIDTGR